MNLANRPTLLSVTGLAAYLYIMGIEKDISQQSFINWIPVTSNIFCPTIFASAINSVGLFKMTDSSEEMSRMEK